MHYAFSILHFGHLPDKAQFGSSFLYSFFTGDAV